MGAMKNLLIELYNQGVWECPNTGILIPLGQNPISSEEIEEFRKVCEMSEEGYDMYWNQVDEKHNHATDKTWQEAHGDGY
jgi:hypothetical protein